ncbi:MAG: hypothetical protein BGO68_02785 [Candidatus Amoebophilus sp. 36-38]|nr:MAG: hypothetical protein BGO68_02785 [Candidatus Amoebophilus sp. 36-38]
MEDAVIIPCGHTFSQRELLDWLKREKSCPTCRKSVTEDEVIPNLILREIIENVKNGKKKDT